MQNERKKLDFFKAEFYFLAQAEGFSPLAARPARQLLIAAFAVGFIVNLAIVGKAFCSRKTAPTLESLRKI